VIVLDASAAVEWLLGMPHADQVQNRLADSRETLHAPHLLGVEVAQVVRRFAARGDITAERGEAALTDLADLDVAHYPHEPLLPIVWRLRAILTAYDAVYVALAEALGATLLTLDAHLATAPHRVEVDLII